MGIVSATGVLARRTGGRGIGIGIGIDPATLSPTGHWLGGVGVTVDTAPTPDVMTYWLGQGSVVGGGAAKSDFVGRQPEAFSSAHGVVPNFRSDLLGSDGEEMQVHIGGSMAGYYGTNRDDWTAVFAVVAEAAAHDFRTNQRTACLIADNGFKHSLQLYDASGELRSRAYGEWPGVTVTPHVVVTPAVITVLAMRNTGGVLSVHRVDEAGSVSVSVAVAGLMTGTPQSIRFGSMGQPASDGYNGRIYEAATFTPALTDGEIADVAAFLLHRYASAT